MPVALITGCSSGIGRALADAFKAAGYQVWTTARRAEDVATLAAAGFTAVPLDVNDGQALEQLGERINQQCGGLDVLVNNAGGSRDVLFRQMSPDDWNAVMGSNLHALFNITKQVIDGMSTRGWGRIVNIGSVSAHKGQIGQVNFATAKAAMHGFSRALANEVATRGVTVNTISPGYIASQSISSFPPDVLDRLAGSVPIRRLGKPEEVASLCAWLASDDAAYVTGADYAVNGGLHMF